MTDLSPQAQAVLDAVKEICPAPADEIAATALRAAAYTIDWESGDPKFLLENVATELES